MSNSIRFKAKNGLDNNSLTIINVADPVNAQDVATKNYATNASNLASGTIASSILGNSSTYVGTTAVALNRASANLALTGISSVTLPGSTSGSVQIIPTAAAGTGTILTLPATTGTVVTTGDTGSVTNTMLAGSIANTKLSNSSITINGTAVSLGGTATISATVTNSQTIKFDTGTTEGTDLYTFDGSAAKTIDIKAGTNITLTKAAGSITIASSEVDSLQTVTTRGNTTTTAISISNATASSSTGTGALIVTGGVGIGGALNVGGDLTLTGNLTINGTTTTLNSTTLTVDDKNIELGSIASPTNTTADGGGITLKGTTDKTFNWVNSPSAWTSSENVDLASGKVYEIAGTTVLSGTTLGSGVTSSSLTSVGTITSGTWSGSFGAVSGANLTSLTAGNLSGTIPSAVLGNSTTYVGTTAVALNRASANLALTGISSVTLPGSTSGSVQIIPTAAAGTGTVLTLPATTGTVITTGDSATVTNTMLAGSIANAKLANSTISGVALGSNLNALTLGTGLTGTSYNGSAAVTVNVDSTAAGTPSIYSSITTGSLTIGAGLTTGSISIATGTDSAKVVNIGTASTTSTVTGIVKLPTVGTSGFVKLGAGGQLSADTSTYLTTESDTLSSVTGRGATTSTAVTLSGGVTSNSISTTNGNITSGSLTTSTTAANQVVLSHAIATYRSVSYQIQVTSGTSYHTTKVDVLHDGTTAYVDEYGTMFTGVSLATFDADISTGNLRLLVTPVNAVTTIKVIASAVNI